MGITLQHEAPHSRPSSPTTGPTTTVTETETQTQTETTVSATVSARRAARAMTMAPATKIVVPLRYSAWLNGDMGRALEHMVESSLNEFPDLSITKLPRAFLVEAHEEAGPFLEAVHRAALQLEERVAATYPVLHHELGPVWTGTLQCVFA